MASDKVSQVSTHTTQLKVQDLDPGSHGFSECPGSQKRLDRPQREGRIYTHSWDNNSMRVSLSLLTKYW